MTNKPVEIEHSEQTTNAPKMGTYYSIPVGAERARNALSPYEPLFPAMAQIRDYMAFHGIASPGSGPTPKS
jgi:uncharacterized protein (DUF427 family)